MSNKDLNETFSYLIDTLFVSPSDYHLKMHKMYQPMPVYPEWEIEPNRINTDMHLLYVIKGTGTYTLANEVITMKKGQLFLVSNGYPHSSYSDPDDLIHMFSMRFGIYDNHSKKFISNFFKEPFGLVLTPPPSALIQDKLSTIYKHYLEDTSIKDAITTTLMNHILLDLCSIADTTGPLAPIRDLTKLITLNHGTNISVTDLASRTHLSTKQFTRLFTQANHTTPHQFIISTRINHGKYLLEETNLSIKNIAQELGYSDAFSFSKQFKKITGRSPTSHRSSQTSTIESNNYL